MAVLAIVGQLISYLLSVLFARRLGVEDFEAYVVAAAVFLLMVAIAPLGLDKLALRRLPPLLLAQDLRRARSFLRFGVRRSLAAACVIGLVVALGTRASGWISTATSAAILVSCLSLPGGALAHFGVEVLAATGEPVRATAILRIVVPVTAFALFGLSLLVLPQPGGWAAVTAWGIAWLVAAGLLVINIRRALPASIFRSAAIADQAEWTAEALPFSAYRMIAMVTAQSGILMLDWLQPSATAVGAFAAVLATVAPAVTAVTATNRAYAAELVALLERRDRAGLRALNRRRLRWLGPVVVAFLFVALVLPRPALSLFGQTFADEGADALRVIALATSYAMVFALAPSYLKYAGRHRVIAVIQMAAITAQIVLAIVFIPGWGATGAAISVATASIGMYTAFALAARGSIFML